MRCGIGKNSEKRASSMSAVSPEPHIQKEQRAWNTREIASFYQTKRSQPEHLYPTEKYFLPDILPKVKTVLDVGCATGGFYRIMRAFHPEIQYVGVDISPDLVAQAKRDYPEAEFHVSDGVHLDFLDRTFDLVHSSGVLHLNSAYRQMVQAMWARAGRYLLCDFRLTWGKSLQGTLTLEGAQAQDAPLPYNVLNVSELMVFLDHLEPSPISIQAKGYLHEISHFAKLDIRETIMAFFLLSKNPNECRERSLTFYQDFNETTH
jgi:SAM-dependent methyltransferase